MNIIGKISKVGILALIFLILMVGCVPSEDSSDTDNDLSSIPYKEVDLEEKTLKEILESPPVKIRFVGVSGEFYLGYFVFNMDGTFQSGFESEAQSFDVIEKEYIGTDTLVILYRIEYDLGNEETYNLEVHKDDIISEYKKESENSSRIIILVKEVETIFSQQ